MTKRKMIVQISISIAAIIALSANANAQAPGAAPMPMPVMQFLGQNGQPLAGGKLCTYLAGTSTPAPTYSDSSGTIQNTNPVILDAGGRAPVWLGLLSYRIVLYDSSGTPATCDGVQQWSADNVSNLGLINYGQMVLLNPAGQALQTIAGPLAAQYFSGTAPHTTSPGVRVALLDPNTVLDTALNPPNFQVATPAASGQSYIVPDPAVNYAGFVLSPNPSMVHGTANALDCTQAGLTCYRTANIYFEGGGCNNATATLGWDTFGTGAPVPICTTGTNIVKGVMGLPGAATKVQDTFGTGSAAGTCTLTYPVATIAGDLLEAEIIVDGSNTISGVTDGTNAYTKVISITNGVYDTEIWYFNGSSTLMAAGTTLTFSLSGTGNSACTFKEYKGIKTSGALDTYATATGTGTNANSGYTLGTAQPTELILGVGGTAGAPSFTWNTGRNPHQTVANGTHVSISSEGTIAQATGTQSSQFALSASEAWMAATVAFKVNVSTNVTAERHFGIPAFYNAAQPVNASIKWQNQLGEVNGSVQVALGAAIVCVADGSTDDPVFNTQTVARPLISQSYSAVVTTTPFNGLVSTGCAAGNLMHYQIQRLRYDPLDSYEGYVYVVGSTLQFGITQ